MENILLEIFESPICDNHSLIGDSRGGRKKMKIEIGYMNFKIWLADWQSSQLNRQLQKLQGRDAHIMFCTYCQSSWCHLRLPNEEWTRLSVSAKRSSPNLQRSDAPWLRVRLKNTKWEFSFLLRVKGNHIAVISIFVMIFIITIIAIATTTPSSSLSSSLLYNENVNKTKHPLGALTCGSQTCDRVLLQ